MSGYDVGVPPSLCTRHIQNRCLTYTVQRHLEGSILLKWVIWHVPSFSHDDREQGYTFCLLIVQYMTYMLSDKIKGKSALKPQTFLHEHDKVHVRCWFRLSMYLSTENSAGSNYFKTLHWRNVYL